MESKVYLENGQEVLLVSRSDDCCVVRSIYEIDDHEQVGDKFIVSKVYDVPPTEKLHNEVSALYKQIEELIGIKEKAVRDIKSINEQNKSFLDKCKKYEQLKNLEDFIDGKITHYAFLSYEMKIYSLKELYERNDENHRTYEQRLLCLYGKANGDLVWKLNKWNDGSGFDYNVIPCRSYEEAVECLQKYLDDSIKNGVKDYHVKASEKYNLHIDPEKLNAYRQEKINYMVKNIDKKREELKELEEELCSTSRGFEVVK